MIGLILVHPLDGRAWSSGLDDEVGLINDRLAPQGNSRLPRESIEKTLARPAEARFLVSLQLDTKTAIDDELPLAHLELRGQRHDGKRLIPLRANQTGEGQDAND